MNMIMYVRYLRQSAFTILYYYWQSLLVNIQEDTLVLKSITENWDACKVVELQVFLANMLFLYKLVCIVEESGHENDQGHQNKE